MPGVGMQILSRCVGLIRCRTIYSGVGAELLLGDRLILIRSRHGSVWATRHPSPAMPLRDTPSWNAIIHRHLVNGCLQSALQLFWRMGREGVKPDRITYLTTLGSFSGTEALLAHGRLIHAHMVGCVVEPDVAIQTALMNMYAKCGSIHDALRVFDKMQRHDLVSWTSIIAIHAKSQFTNDAFRLFRCMQQAGLEPDKITYISILNACQTPDDIGLGKIIHAQISDSSVQSDLLVGTALVHMYANCRALEDAWQVFDMMVEKDVVFWTAMIAAFAEHSHKEEAFLVFKQMQQQGIQPNKVTFISILNACDCPKDLVPGKLLHAQIINGAFELDVVIGTALMSMYGKCGDLEDVRRTFDKMPQRNVLTWNAMLDGCIQHGHFKAGLEYFQQMHHDGVKPDQITLISILNACTGPEGLEVGKLLHSYAIARGFETDVAVGTTLLKMYGRCGDIEDAERAFMLMPEGNVVSWTAMISAYAQHGHGKKCLETFNKMLRKGVNPNDVTFLNVLNACSHAGFVDEGLSYFEAMIENYGITPTLEHYNCIIDLFGRAGWLDDAEDFIERMPFQPDSVMWMTLLGSCRIHGCFGQGKHAAEYALQFDPHFSSAYVVLANICASV